MKWVLGISLLCVHVCVVRRIVAKIEAISRSVREIKGEMLQLSEGVTFLTEQFAEHGHFIRDDDGDEVLACTDAPTNLIDMLQAMEHDAVENGLITRH